MKKLKYVFLAILSLFVFGFSACASEISSSSSSSSSEASEENLDFFNATNYDFSFETSLSEDKTNVVINATPKYHIGCLEIKTTLYYSSDTHLNPDIKEISYVTSFKQAVANQILTFRVYLPEELASKDNTIRYYNYEVTKGYYDTQTHQTKENFSNTEEYQNNLSSWNLIFSEGREYATIEFLPIVNLYDATFEISITLTRPDETYLLQQHKYTYTQAMDFIPNGQKTFLQITPPQSFLEQSMKISYVRVTLEGTYRTSAIGSIPTDEYWKQFPNE